MNLINQVLDFLPVVCPTGIATTAGVRGGAGGRGFERSGQCSAALDQDEQHGTVDSGGGAVSAGRRLRPMVARCRALPVCGRDPGGRPEVCGAVAPSRAGRCRPQRDAAGGDERDGRQLRAAHGEADGLPVSGQERGGRALSVPRDADGA